jgi:2-methylcitrate dehydratase
MAAAAMAGSLLRLDPAHQAQAINLAATPNVALMQTRVGTLSMWKAVAAAYAARAGLTAALLALHGVTGPDHALDGKHGLFAQVTGAPVGDAFAAPPGPLHLLDTHLKAYPCQYFTQTAVDAALALRPRVRVAAVRRIEVSTFEFGRVAAADSPEKWRPLTRETADHSLPYCVAVALLDGRLGERQFDVERIQAPDVAALLARIVVVEDPAFTRQYPKQVPARVRIEHDDGDATESTVEYPSGHSRNPMDRERVEAKYVDLGGSGSRAHLAGLWAIPRLSGPQLSALLQAVVG